jgi:hypothetical protein
MRAADSATKRREVVDFDKPAPRTSPPRSRTERANLWGRDVDQHLVHCPFAEPVLGNRRFPARQNVFLAVKTAQPRASNRSISTLPPCKYKRVSRSCLSSSPSGALGDPEHDHDAARRPLAHRNPSSRQGSPCRTPGRTARSSPICSPELPASTLSSEWQSM